MMDSQVLFILLSFGAAVTWAHCAILAGSKKQVVYALVATKRPLAF
jgi:hypothetical protein